MCFVLLTVNKSVSEVHSGAESVDQNLGDFCRIKVWLPAELERLVEVKSLRLGSVSAGEQQHVHVGRVCADQESSAVQRILQNGNYLDLRFCIYKCLLNKVKINKCGLQWMWSHWFTDQKKANSPIPIYFT